MLRNNTLFQELLTALLALFALLSAPAHSATLSLAPASQSVAPGGTAAVDLNISGLGNFAAPSLGAFLVEVTFDAGGKGVYTYKGGLYLLVIKEGKL